jgi:hypothetical protein
MRRIKLAIVATCAAVTAATITPAQATEVQLTASTGSLENGSTSIEAGFNAYMRCIKGLSHGKVLPPGFCLTEGLITSS